MNERPEVPAVQVDAGQPAAAVPTQSTGDTQPLITCPSCRGKGQVKLPWALQTTLDLLRAAGRATAGDLARRDAASPDARGKQVGTTAFNNRLEDLRQLGLVARHSKRGKAWLYELTPVPAT